MSIYPLFTNKKGQTMIFYPVPKNANTSAKYFLIKHMDKESEYKTPIDLNDENAIRYLSKELPKVTNFLPSKQEFDFAVADEKAVILREPIKRFISAYANRVISDEVGQFRGHTLDQVIDRLLNGYFGDKHFKPQTWFIGTDLNYYSIIGTTENIKPFVDGINKFFEKNIKFPRVLSRSSDIKVKLNQSQINKLKNIYSKDIELYNQWQ